MLEGFILKKIKQNLEPIKNKRRELWLIQVAVLVLMEVAVPVLLKNN